MKSTHRALGLAAALTLASFASAHGVSIGSCTYRCRNAATGQSTIVTSATTEAACCDGVVTCPAGSTYAGTLSYNTNGRGPVRCL